MSDFSCPRNGDKAVTIRTIAPVKTEHLDFPVASLKSSLKPITPWSPLKAMKRHRDSLSLLIHWGRAICSFAMLVARSYTQMLTGLDGGMRDWLGCSDATLKKTHEWGVTVESDGGTTWVQRLWSAHHCGIWQAQMHRWLFIWSNSLPSFLHPNTW